MGLHAAVWLSFWLGIAVSLAVGIAAAPTLTWQPVLVAAGGPLLAAELLAHGPRSREQTEIEPAVPETDHAVSAVDRDSETDTETESGQVFTLATVSPTTHEPIGPIAEPSTPLPA